MTTKEQVAARVKLNADARSILDKAEKEKRGLTAEERETVKRLDSEIQDLSAAIAAAATEAEEERALRATFAAHEDELGESRGRKTRGEGAGEGAGQASAEDRSLAFRGWCLGQQATDEMRAAAERCGVEIGRRFIDMAARVGRDADGRVSRTFFPVRANSNQDIEARALSIGTTTAGGNSVPNEMMRAFYEVQKWYGSARAAAQVINTETGATLPWPTVSDTANSGRILAEATAATTTTDPTFGVVNLGAFKFSSDAVLVSWELLQDSFINLETYLGTALGRRIGRIQNTKFTVGVGTTEPKGFIPGGTVGVTAGTSTAFTLDDVISLIHSVDLAYRNLPGTGFQVHDTIAAYLRKFKDGNGQYLWEMSTQVGQPDRLFGYPVSINNDMDSALTTGKKLLAFGNLGLAFIVRDAGAVRFVRSDEKYILEHQVMFEASQRSDSNVVDTTAIKILALA
jgi:HK97 family phage major capsid protein